MSVHVVEDVVVAFLTEVAFLGEERQRAELRIGCLEERGARAEVELTLAGLLALGDRVVRREPDEVV